MYFIESILSGASTSFSTLPSWGRSSVPAPQRRTGVVEERSSAAASSVKRELSSEGAAVASSRDAHRNWTTSGTEVPRIHGRRRG